MRKRRIASIFAIVMAAVLSVACGRDEYAPRAVNEETDRCAYCNMAVADDAHATQIVLKDGRTLIFDDIGCMYAWLAENGDGDVGASFVRDYGDLGWIKTEKAYYVYDASFRTPMAYGVLSFADKADAEAFIAEQGKGVLMTADDLSGHSWERNRDMMDGMGGHHHGADGTVHEEGEGAHGGTEMDGGHSGHGDGAMNGQAGGHDDAAHDGADHGDQAAGGEAHEDAGHDGGDAHGGTHDDMNAHTADGAVSAA